MPRRHAAAVQIVLNLHTVVISAILFTLFVLRACTAAGARCGRASTAAQPAGLLRQHAGWRTARPTHRHQQNGMPCRQLFARRHAAAARLNGRSRQTAMRQPARTPPAAGRSQPGTTPKWFMVRHERFANGNTTTWRACQCGQARHLLTAK